MFCLIGTLFTPIYARADGMTVLQLKNLCTETIPACGIYLQGVLDGVLQASKIDRTQIVCPESVKSPAQLKEYFIVASALAGDKYDQDPAMNMIMAAFTIAMPCKG
jgi:hypothetical protein